jgi:molybdopterin molybdotransferase
MPGPAAIRDSNGPMLAALAGPWAEHVLGLGIVPDDAEALGAAIRTGLGTADVLLVSGGVSMGRYDLVAAALAAAGVRFHFQRVALQPGKPTGFGTHAGGVVLALPGNPVSAFVTFRLFAALALARQEGETAARPRWTRAAAGFAWTRRNPKWLVLPGHRRQGAVDRVPYTGSGDLLAYAAADCHIVLPPDVAAVGPGDPVAVWPL